MRYFALTSTGQYGQLIKEIWDTDQIARYCVENLCPTGTRGINVEKALQEWIELFMAYEVDENFCPILLGHDADDKDLEPIL